MTTPLLRTALEPIVARHRLLRLLAWLAIALLGVAAIGALVLHSVPLVIVAALGAAWAAWRYAALWQPDYAEIARHIEERRPDLQHLIRTAVEQAPDAETGKLNYLQLRVVAEAVGACQRSEVMESVPKSRIAAGWLAVACSVGVLGYTLSTLPVSPERTIAAKTAPIPNDGVEVTPGDTSVERGSGLVVLAKFHKDVPSEAALIVTVPNQPQQRFSLVKNLNDPVFGGGLPEVTTDLSYRVEYAGKATRDFQVLVFEHPRLERADVALHFPEYTKLPDKQIPDTRRVTAVEGTKLGVTFALNKPVRKATLVAKDGAEIALTVDPAKPLAELTGYVIAKSGVYELRLEDAEGRAAKVPSQFTIEAQANRRPELKVHAPRGDVRLSAIEEVTYGIEVWDDFGTTATGFTYNLAAGEQKDVRLAEGTKADERVKFPHTLRLEDLGAKPDEMLSWFVWAEDVGPDGAIRRTASDMYFGEVRPFEEIYRQGQAQEGQQQQQQSAAGNQAQQFAADQKKVIIAAWNLQRAEQDAEKPSEKYLKDEPVVHDAQAEVLLKTKELVEKIEDPKSRAFSEAATEHMEKALAHFKEAQTTTKPLPDAIQAGQAAYNALLKLAKHEYEVTNSRSQSRSQSAQSQQQQQQLDQLEMKEDEKRYETQSEAESPQEEAQREQVAALSRLKELAQRQNDVNERLKELQAALQQAKDEEEKAKLERELKRLREEQQEMLADMDELKQNMEKPENQSQFAEDRKKLEETRAEAQKAAEAMEKGEASKALASGTRAKRELEEMSDDLRKRTSKQFTDEMRKMRTDAREIAEKQGELAEKLAEGDGKPERRTLDGSGEREKAAKELGTQQKQFSALTENMKRVSEQAEVAEPLLARELYDTLRKSAQAGTEQTLDNTRELAERGYAEQARKFEEKARAEIEDVKAGVERAAEHVLGDEAEALKRARAELDQLAQELDKEIASNTGRKPGEQSGERTSDEQESGKAPGEMQAQQPVENGEPSQDGQQPGKEGGAQPGEREGQQAGEQAGQPNGEQTGERREGNGRQPGEQPGQEGGQPSSQKGEQPGQQPGEQPSQNGQQPGQRGEGQPQQPGGQQPGGQQPGQRGEQQGQQGGQQPSQNGQQPGQQPGQQQGQQPGEQPGQGEGGQGGDSPQSRAEQGGKPGERQQSRLSQLTNAPRERNGGDGNGRWGGGAEDDPAGPLTGERYVEWQDRLRNVEEMLDDPKLRNEATRVREIAKGVRAEFKRHSVEPKWDMVEAQIRKPLTELRNRVAEELARRDKTDTLVPIDRDPVPTEFADRVRQYYEDLGSSRR